MAYASRSPHRFRSVGVGVARVLLVEAARDDRRDRGRNDGRDAECTDHAAGRSRCSRGDADHARPSRGPTGWAARSKRRGSTRRREPCHRVVDAGCRAARRMTFIHAVTGTAHHREVRWSSSS